MAKSENRSASANLAQAGGIRLVDRSDEDTLLRGYVIRFYRVVHLADGKLSMFTAMSAGVLASHLRLVPSCFVIFDLEPLSLSLDFFEHEHVVMNPTSAGMRHHHLHLYVDSKNLLDGVLLKAYGLFTDVSRIACLLGLETIRLNQLQSTLVSDTAPGIWDPFSDCSGTADASPRETDRGRQAQLTEALRLVRDMRREMGDMQTELLSQREQLRRERQPGPDAMLPDHQEATGDSESHT
ncbi:hypothetical protein Tco_0157183 [Tanacetum coccineum]